ncbi:hypothetical protein ATN84_06995 [Paramesorhizobium deserti]|uniref:Two-component system response regulator n=1 Tax=Paramesorhizobium deserti TaxID=1494590 RepID=A0A135I1W5_9HYPH|nr:response regulator transcription factor [Paramesorhizobium deserti]KXF79436.1 hypothetical protein ATN84_06995 [Paramesorhizobium deserti]
MKPLVLICSRNPDLFLLFSHILVAEGFRARLVDESSLIESVKGPSVLCILLDTENNASEALHLCGLVKENRASAHVPLVALTPAGDQDGYLDLLKAGVDECLVRPISPARILGYLKALVAERRHGGGLDIERKENFQVWDLDVEAAKRLIRYRGQEMQLGPIEFKLLCRLLDAPGRVFSRAELIEAGWPPNYYVQPRTVDVHMGRLRRLLEQMTGRSIIRTIRSTGYAVEFS